MNGIHYGMMHSSYITFWGFLWPWPREKVKRNQLFRPVWLLYLLRDENRKRSSLLSFLGVALLNLVNPALPDIKCKGNSTHHPEISHKYTGETVSTTVILSVSLLVPLFELLVAEWFVNRKSQNPYGFHPVESSRWKRTLFYSFRWYRDYFFGLSFMLLINDIAKTTVGAPRPHWLDTCGPQFPAENCHLGWVQNYTCSSTKFSRWRMADARKSFPSGHAALSLYAALFMIMYQNYRLNVKKLGSIVILWLHCIWGSWAVYCALSRISDRRHHPVDVIGGGILGLVISFFTSKVLCGKFRKEFHLESYQNKIVSGLNGNATILEGYTSSPPNMNPNGGSTTLNGGINRANGDVKRPSLRRLLSTQSTLTTMSDIAEDRELDNL
ncbi:unnamed protein product [Allacma fusca]|uniref:Phosphatidic acid phosphatase type 2/haloperoxidase domain-containing protein n=1 Tax=Allacma fusca TaxID=39272 RepID=A0A8J2KYS9_9HEXA|nr:unnamed protein product [Allacma fusca]